MRPKKTQKEEVIKYLERHGSITPMQAFKHLGITKLATVVSDLRLKDGVQIEKEPIVVRTRYGLTHTMRYSFKER